MPTQFACGTLHILRAGASRSKPQARAIVQWASSADPLILSRIVHVCTLSLALCAGSAPLVRVLSLALHWTAND